MLLSIGFTSFFFFNDTATTEIYTLSLHDALPISRLPLLQHLHSGSSRGWAQLVPRSGILRRGYERGQEVWAAEVSRSEEHTSELQSHLNLVCRLLLEKKKKTA